MVISKPTQVSDLQETSCWKKGPFMPFLCQIMPYAMMNRICQNLCWHNPLVPKLHQSDALHSPTVEKKKVHINPTLLFSRLIAIVQREEDMAPFFDYELTTIPTSLFKDSGLRKTDKAQLAEGPKKICGTICTKFTSRVSS